jgi:hypothetical protein
MPFLALLWGSIWARIWSFALLLLPFLVSKIVQLLGVGFVSYVGFDLLLSQVQTYVMGNFDNMGTDLLAILVLAKVDVGLKIVFAAMSTAFALKLLGGVRKTVFGKSGGIAP